MPDEYDRNWLLRCPECGEYVSVELEGDTKAGRVATARCPAAHDFTFQYHDQTTEMRATRATRATLGQPR